MNMSIFIDILLGKRELPPPALPSGTDPLPKWNNELWTSVLKRFVSQNGCVDYVGIQNDIDFIRLVEVVSRQSPQSHPKLFPSPNAKLSFWINAYNILIIWAILSDDISTSVQDSTVPSWIHLNAGQDFFVGNRVQIGGIWMNLYDLENKIIRSFGDGRIHAAINCASNSCPLLEDTAFNSEDLDKRLSEAMKRMVNSNNHLQINMEDQTVQASPIFNWYKSDFNARRQQNLFAYWIEFAEEPLLSQLHQAQTKRFDIRWMEYDWGLNHQRTTSLQHKG